MIRCPALEEAVAAGILVEQCGPGPRAGSGSASCWCGGPCTAISARPGGARLHERAAGLVDRRRALGHRVAAAVGPDDGLAGDLEAAGTGAQPPGQDGAGRGLAGAGGGGEQRCARRRIAACWTRWRSWSPPARWPRRRSLPPGCGPPEPGARRSWLLGALDFLAGRTGAAEERSCARRGRPTIGSGGVRGRSGRHPAGGACAWSRAGSRRRSGGVSGRRRSAAPQPPYATRPWACWRSPCSADGQGTAGPGPAGVPARRPRRGAAGGYRRAGAAGNGKVLAEDLPGAIADFPPRRPGCVPVSRSACQPMPVLPGGRRVPPRMLGRRRAHAELAVSLAQDADRVQDLGLRAQRRRCRSRAARRLGGRPARTSAWPPRPARLSGDPETITAGAIAQAFLAMARGDLEGRRRCRRGRRATGKAEVVEPPGPLRLAIPRDRCPHRPGPFRVRPKRRWPSSRRYVTGRPGVGPGGRRPAARRPGRRGWDQAAAAAAFETAWRRAQGLRVPLALAQLEISDARRLRATGQPQHGRRPAALRPAAPDHPGRPALPADLRPGARRRRRARRTRNRTRPGRPHHSRAGGGPPRRRRPLQPASRRRALRQRQDRRVPPRAYLRQARHPIPAKTSSPASVPPVRARTTASVKPRVDLGADPSDTGFSGR